MSGDTTPPPSGPTAPSEPAADPGLSPVPPEFLKADSEILHDVITPILGPDPAAGNDEPDLL
jgi:hypothetical protein